MDETTDIYSEETTHPYSNYQLQAAVRFVLVGLLTAVSLVYFALNNLIAETEWYVLALLVVVGLGGGVGGSIRLYRWLSLR